MFLLRAYAHVGETMKKNIVKIFTSASIVVAVILIMVLLVTAFGGIDAEEFESKLVRGLICTLGILYLVLAIISLVLIFIRSDVIKEVTLRTDRGGSVRVSSAVVTKFVKTACKSVEGVKCTKVTLVVDEYGQRLKAEVKVVDRDVLETETYLRALLEDLFLGEFGFRFHSIEFKVMSLISKYKADEQAVAEKAAAELEKINAKNAAQIAEEKALEEQEEAAKEEATQEEAVADEQAPAEESSNEEAVEATIEAPAKAELVEEMDSEIIDDEAPAEDKVEEKTEE